MGNDDVFTFELTNAKFSEDDSNTNVARDTFRGYYGDQKDYPSYEEASYAAREYAYAYLVLNPVFASVDFKINKVTRVSR